MANLQRIARAKVGGAFNALWERIHRWPRPPVEDAGEPHFLFILAPPYSGSTALAKILNTSARSIMLQAKGEGQWLAPGMCAKRRWDPDYKMNWDSIRAVWLHRVNLVRACVGQVDLVIEKSPPNMIRLKSLLRTFPNHSLAAFNRNPFANCASILYRNHAPEHKTDDQRAAVVRRLADRWLFRSQWIQRSLDDPALAVPYFTYEEFCADPAARLAQLTPQAPALADADVNAVFTVKDYAPQGLVNQNARQIARLKPREIAVISEQLQTQPELTARMGYDPVLSAEG